MAYQIILGGAQFPREPQNGAGIIGFANMLIDAADEQAAGIFKDKWM